MKRILILHPFFISSYPVVALLAQNIDQISPRDAIRPLTIVLAACILLIMILGLRTRNWPKAALATSWTMLFFFSFGHVIRLVQGHTNGIPVILLFKILFSSWMFFLIFGNYWILRKVSTDLQTATRFLNATGFISLVFPAFAIASASSISTVSLEPPPFGQANVALEMTDDQPDIYYIILDGYGRADVLDEMYQFDNSEFLEFLDKSGFYIATESQSNFGQTHLSIASSMNLSYLDNVLSQVDLSSTNRGPLELAIKESVVRDFSRKLGYQFVVIDSGVPQTQISDADLYLSFQRNSSSRFELMILADTLPGIMVFSRRVLYDMHRNAILYSFQALSNLPEFPGPKLVFAHILSPHPPFVFGRNGEPVQPSRDFSLFDGSRFAGTEEEYRAGYINQLVYINVLLKNALENIINNSEDTPIIIVQSDHGPGSMLDWESLELTCSKERMAILNAYYLPYPRPSALYESISPVNSFRLIFDAYFAGNFELLQDVSYLSLWDSPYDLNDVTSESEESCSPR